MFQNTGAGACIMPTRFLRISDRWAMARVDFFPRPDMSVVVNEVNTIPGFTNISMYPLAFRASGASYPELADRLIRHHLARRDRPLSHLRDRRQALPVAAMA
jgi:hypothetical protein